MRGIRRGRQDKRAERTEKRTQLRCRQGKEGRG